MKEVGFLESRDLVVTRPSQPAALLGEEHWLWPALGPSPSWTEGPGEGRRAVGQTPSGAPQLSHASRQEPYLLSQCDCCSYRLDPESPVRLLHLRCPGGHMEPVVLPVVHSCQCSACQGGSGPGRGGARPGLGRWAVGTRGLGLGWPRVQAGAGS